MSDRPDSPERFSLSRWSRRKLEVAKAVRQPAADTAASAAEPIASPPARAEVESATHAAPDAAPELPPIESLTIDDDFSVFFKPKVDEGLRRSALKKLFSDPHFNVMDGLDVYIDDYTKSDPIPADILAKLEHARYIFAPPKTRVNAQGHVEDVPPEELDEPASQDASTHDAGGQNEFVVPVAAPRGDSTEEPTRPEGSQTKATPSGDASDVRAEADAGADAATPSTSRPDSSAIPATVPAVPAAVPAPSR